MLIYNPTFDAYNCIFRILSILESKKNLEIDKLRILDLLLCCPSAVESFSLPKELSYIKVESRKNNNPYRGDFGFKSLFNNLKTTQEGALSCLAASAFISKENLKSGIIKRTILRLPVELSNEQKKLIERENLFFNVILEPISQIPLFGPGGLKERSGLMEFRYDNI